MPTSVDTRSRRHGAIRALLRRRKVRSQAELGEALAAAGLAVDQSTLCRDLRDLGIAKVDGVYRMPAAGEVAVAGGGDAALPGRRTIARFVTGALPAGPHLLVVRCAPGTASAVGLAIDAEAWPEVAGTLAGDDTLFVATATKRDQGLVAVRLESIIGAGSAAGAAAANGRSGGDS